MLERIIDSAVLQMPALVVFAVALIYIIHLFVKVLSRVADRCHKTQDRSTEAIAKITDALGELTTAVRLMNGGRGGS